MSEECKAVDPKIRFLRQADAASNRLSAYAPPVGLTAPIELLFLERRSRSQARKWNCDWPTPVPWPGPSGRTRLASVMAPAQPWSSVGRRQSCPCLPAWVLPCPSCRASLAFQRCWEAQSLQAHLSWPSCGGQPAHGQPVPRHPPCRGRITRQGRRPPRSCVRRDVSRCLAARCQGSPEARQHPPRATETTTPGCGRAGRRRHRVPQRCACTSMHGPGSYR